MTNGNAPPGYLSSAKNMAAKILRDSDTLSALIEFMDQLPPLLVETYMKIAKSEECRENSAEIEVSDRIYSGITYPGDILIKKNREPKVGDVLFISLKSKEEGKYYTDCVIVKKINIKDGSLKVQNVEDKEQVGLVSPLSILCVLERVVRFGTAEWDALVEMFKIRPDREELKENIKDGIEFVKSSDFYEKEKNLKALTNRLKAVETLL